MTDDEEYELTTSKIMCLTIRLPSSNDPWDKGMVGAVTEQIQLNISKLSFLRIVFHNNSVKLHQILKR